MWFCCRFLCNFTKIAFHFVWNREIKFKVGKNKLTI